MRFDLAFKIETITKHYERKLYLIYQPGFCFKAGFNVNSLVGIGLR